MTIAGTVRAWVAEHGPLRAMPTTRDVEHDLRVELARRSALYCAAAHDHAMQAAILDECGRDFRAWRDSFAWAWDESRESYIPQLSWSHVDEVQAAYLGLDGWRQPLGPPHRVAVHKSRKVQVTVACATAATWSMMWGPEGIQLIVSLNLSSVDDGKALWGTSVMGKVRVMLDAMPRWMLPPSWLAPTRRWVDQHRLLMVPERGTAIVASTANVTARRGGRYIRVWIDEAQDIRHLSRVLQVTYKLAPEIITGTTSASWQGGKNSDWGRLVHGHISALAEPGAAGGVVVRSVRYTASPDMDPTTEIGQARIAAERRDMGEESWAREMELDWGAGVASRIWAGAIPGGNPEALRASADDVRDLFASLDDARIIEAWDFGVQVSLTAWGVGAYVEETDTLYILDYCSWEHGEASEVAALVRSAGWTPHARVGDVAGKQSSRKTFGGRRVKPLHGWIHNLAEEGIHVRGVRLDVERAIDIVRRKLAAGKIKILPAAMARRAEQQRWPSIAEVIVSYSRDVPDGTPAEEYVGEMPGPRKDMYSHGADALQHMAMEVWG